MTAPSTLLLIALTSSAESIAEAGEPSASDTISIPVSIPVDLPVLLIQTTQTHRVRGHAILRSFGDSLYENTRFTAREIDSGGEGVAACGGRLVCLTRVADRELGAGSAESNRGLPYFVLITLFGLSDDRPDRLGLVLVNGVRALRAGAAEQDDAIIEEEATLFHAETEVEDESAAAAFVVDTIVSKLRRFFEKSGDWRPYARIHLQAPVAGLSIHVDGRLIGTTVAGVQRLERVAPGAHRLELSHGDYEPFEARVELWAGQDLEVVASPRARPGLGKVVRSTTIVAGLVAAGAGLVFSALALAEAGSARTVECIVFGDAESSCGEGAELIRLGSSSRDDSVSPFADPNPGSVALLPLGFGLLGMGSIWSLGSLLSTEEDEYPVVPLVAGAAILTLAYGVSIAVDGSNALERSP